MKAGTSAVSPSMQPQDRGTVTVPPYREPEDAETTALPPYREPSGFFRRFLPRKGWRAKAASRSLSSP